MSLYDDYFDTYMEQAIAEARKALAEKETPVGCVVVVDDSIIGRGHNLCEKTGDPTMHAEMMALREALKSVGQWKLREATVFVTLEPCPMCAGAMSLAMIQRLVFGAFDEKMGAVGTLYDIAGDKRLNHRIEVISGIKQKECQELLKTFFSKLRDT